jgi:hypothetical protein
MFDETGVRDWLYLHRPMMPAMFRPTTKYYGRAGEPDPRSCPTAILGRQEIHTDDLFLCVDFLTEFFDRRNPIFDRGSNIILDGKENEGFLYRARKPHRPKFRQRLWPSPGVAWDGRRDMRWH